ncbi:hypothetical protein D9613_011357 [Agrocybe pediades]|uniref:DUF6697 domain-containing protein n=1 Tax=Agrocybe pediades TaxID=84607 RepID=A0A8H4VMB3_9AGAR|nr:hypothetical protein D9613_011357 [Agrocybe pediades]
MEFQSKELHTNVKVEQQEPDPTILQDDVSRQESLRSETEERDPNSYVPIPEPEAEADTLKIKKRSPSPTIVAVRIERDQESSSPSRPAKRRKVEVVLLPLADIKKLEKARDHVDFQKLKAMKNPMVKKKKDMELSLRTVRDRLIPIGGADFFDITLPQPDREVMPSDEGYKEVLRVFTRIKDGIWQYMGMYELKGCTPPSLTRAEWQEQPQKVRSKWAKEICRQGWGENIRAGILGRKMFGKRRLTKEEFDEAMSKTDALNSITPDEVYRALDEGIESLGVYTMKCVGYDNAFQLEICEKFASYIPPPPKARKAANATKPPGQKQNKAPATSKIRGKKRKRQSSKNDHDSDNTDGEREWAAEESDGHEGVELKVYKNRGTRSRPTVPT